ncbi:very short patch repair endonuclease [Dyadobacter pollutisoli]|uniref:very short patch repair endonuclease n=1 Tax=Dyadobacter pollutisoli TaxID=2910158 RepID=UPI0035B61FA1
MDRLTREQRSALMSKVKSKHTSIELFVRKQLWSAGFRYRLHVKKLPGTPDLVFKGRKKVIFVHGCFWHGHPCRRLPKTRVAFWEEKIARNVSRDEENIKKLTSLGWSILVVWECELRDPNFINNVARFINEPSHT